MSLDFPLYIYGHYYYCFVKCLLNILPVFQWFKVFLLAYKCSLYFSFNDKFLSHFRLWTITLTWENTSSPWWFRCSNTALVLNYGIISSSHLVVPSGPLNLTSGRCGWRPCLSFFTRSVTVVTPVLGGMILFMRRILRRPMLRIW